jgi:hypothetical protein
LRLRKGSATTDGLWFTKPASSTSVNLVSTVGSTATTLVTGVPKTPKPQNSIKMQQIF